MKIPLSYGVRSLLVRKTTSIATVLGIALVVLVLASSLMLAAGVRQTLTSSASSENVVVLRKGADSELTSSVPSDSLGIVLAAPGVKRNAAGQPLGIGDLVVVLAMNRVGGEPGQLSSVLTRGIQSNAFEMRPQVRLIQGRQARAGTDEAIVGKGVLGRCKGLTLGSSFELRKGRSVTVVGVFEAQGSSFESEVWLDVETLRSAVGRDGLFSSLTVALESAEKYDTFSAAVVNDKRLGLEVLHERAYYEKQSEGTSMVVSTLGVITAVFFSIGAIIGAAITMYGSVAQRSREIGTLRALGFSRRAILTTLTLESTILALTGSAIGSAFSLLTSFFKISTINYNTWQEISFSFQPSTKALLTAIIAGGLIGFVGGFWPALRAARTSPLEAMRA